VIKREIIEEKVIKAKRTKDNEIADYWYNRKKKLDILDSAPQSDERKMNKKEKK
jgi:hypothetical protein